VRLAFVKRPGVGPLLTKDFTALKERVLRQVNGILGGLRTKARGYRQGRSSDVPCGRRSPCRLLCDQACYCRLGAERRALLLAAYRSRRLAIRQVNKNK
jgi:hypothetical protein